MSAGATVTRKSRMYLHEIDMVRVVTALSVIAVHVVAFTAVYNSTNLGVQLQNGVVTALHFTREVFIVLTAFVMVHNYTQRPLKLSVFWRRRGLGVVVPYVVWSLFYVWFSYPRQPAGAWLHTALADILTGNASYQLYYILLTIEFYIILPLLLWFVVKYRNYPWQVLSLSLVAQVGLMYFDFHYLETNAFGASGLANWINDYSWRMLPAYQFYIFLGAYGALYLHPLRDFVQRHGKLVVLSAVGGIGLLWVRYAKAIWFDHQSIAYATQVFQPVMVVYAATTTLFLYWLGVTWATHPSEKGKPYGHSVAKLLSDGSFGIYLIHAFILNDVLTHIGPRLPSAWPAPLRVFSVWFIVALITCTLCSLMLYTPGFSRLIGRPCQLPPDFGPWRWARQRGSALKANFALLFDRRDDPIPRRAALRGGRVNTIDEIGRGDD